MRSSDNLSLVVEVRRLPLPVAKPKGDTGRTGSTRILPDVGATEASAGADEQVPPTEGADRSTETFPENLLFRPYTLTDARAELVGMGPGMPTGFPTLDAFVRFRPGKVYVLAGRQGEGKTTFGLNLLLRHVEERARRLPSLAHLFAAAPCLSDADLPDPQHDRTWETVTGPAVYVGYEGSRAEIYVRLVMRQIAVQRVGAGRPVGSASQMDVERFLRGEPLRPGADAEFTADEIARAVERLDAYGRAGLLVLVDGDEKDRDLRSLLDALRRGGLRARPSLLVIDYYQKARVPADLQSASRQQQLAAISGEILRYAKGMVGDTLVPGQAVPVLVGAQVARSQVKTGEQPTQDAIREADDLVNDASVVLTLSRPKDREGNAGATGEDRRLNLAIVKNRDGRRDVIVPFAFAGDAYHVQQLDDGDAKHTGHNSNTEGRSKGSAPGNTKPVVPRPTSGRDRAANDSGRDEDADAPQAVAAVAKPPSPQAPEQTALFSTILGAVRQQKAAGNGQ